MNNKRKSPTVYRYVLGYTFLFFGLVAGFLPILQGWIFVLIGLVLLKDDRWARRARIWLHRRYPDSRPAFRATYKKIDEWLAKWWGI